MFHEIDLHATKHRQVSAMFQYHPTGGDVCTKTQWIIVFTLKSPTLRGIPNFIPYIYIYVGLLNDFQLVKKSNPSDNH